MGRKAVGPVCCVNARKRTQDTYCELEGACPGVAGFAPSAPSRVDMCALQIFCIIIIIIIIKAQLTFLIDMCTNLTSSQFLDNDLFI